MLNLSMEPLVTMMMSALEHVQVGVEHCVIIENLFYNYFQNNENSNGKYIQKLVQLTDTPIFTFFGKVSVISKMSVNFRTSKMSVFW